MNTTYPTEEYDQADEPTKDSALSRLDQEIGRYRETVEHLAKCLSPVLSKRAENDSDPAVKPLPVSELRGRADRLAETTGRLDRIIRDLDL